MPVTSVIFKLTKQNPILSAQSILPMISPVYSLKFISLLTWLALFSILLAGCSAAIQTAQTVSTDESSPALFQVITQTGNCIPFTADKLKNLPTAQVTVQGKVEEGPKLLEVLQAAGIEDFKQVTISGSNGEITLSQQQVTEQIILDFTNRGTVKLAAVDIPKEGWIKDISLIEVE